MPQKNLHVLVADDQPVNLRLAVRLLRDMGHGGVVVNNGEQALAATRDQAFDLLLLDVNMPVMDGVSALKQLRREESHQHQRLPIVMVTGNDTPESTEAYLRDGADAVLVKPLELEKLNDILKRLRLS